MKQLLWINACMRGPGKSRTDGLCRAFLMEWLKHNPDGEVIERDLTSGEAPMLTAALAEQRDHDVGKCNWDSHLLTAAREVAAADLVVIGAPYWDLAFPAALKTYLEWASTLGITFHYTESGASEGLCKADRLLYITTSGGPLGDNLGFRYVKALGQMLGISAADCVAAENLDVFGGPGEENLRKALAELTGLAKKF